MSEYSYKGSCNYIFDLELPMKKLILILIGAILVALAATSAVKADCDTDPGDLPNFFE